MESAGKRGAGRYERGVDGGGGEVGGLEGGGERGVDRFFGVEC